MNYKKVAIFITFACLWLSGFISPDIEQYVALSLILTIGLLHGSNDLRLMDRIGSMPTKSRGLYYLLSYLAVVIIVGLSFLFFPKIALFGFVLLSAFHFGEQHWNDLAQSKLFSVFFNGSYGLIILFLLFFTNPLETKTIIYDLTNFSISPNMFKWVLIVSFIIWTILMVQQIICSKLQWNRFIFEMFLLVVFMIVFKTGHLIWGFAIYFIIWHSVPSIQEQVKFLYGDTALISFWNYFKQSYLIWVISMIGLFIFYHLLKHNGTLFKPFLFAFLGSITFAHSFIISRVFNGKS